MYFIVHGHTGNRLQSRMEQHSDVFLSNDPESGKKGQTALIRHFQDVHASDLDNVSTLVVESNDFKRKILESLCLGTL